MTIVDVVQRLEEIIKYVDDDPERAHGLEDKLLWEYVRFKSESDPLAKAIDKFDIAYKDRERW